MYQMESFRVDNSWGHFNLWTLNTVTECQCTISASTSTQHWLVYWVEMFDNVIQKPALRKCTQVSLSRLNLTQTVVESLKLKTQNFMLFFNNMILYSLKTPKRLNKYNWNEFFIFKLFNFISFPLNYSFQEFL